MRVVRHWNTSPREAVDVPPPFKAKLNGALSDWIQWMMILAHVREAGLDNVWKSLPTQAVLWLHDLKYPAFSDLACLLVGDAVHGSVGQRSGCYRYGCWRAPQTMLSSWNIEKTQDWKEKLVSLEEFYSSCELPKKEGKVANAINVFLICCDPACALASQSL